MVDSVCVCVYDGGEHSSDVCANSLVKNNRSSSVVLCFCFCFCFLLLLVVVVVVLLLLLFLLF